MRKHLKPIALTADIKQAFLQACIRAEDRDVLRFHWIKNKDPFALRFTRALFRLVQSPFLLAGTLQLLLENLRGRYPIEAEEILRSQGCSVVMLDHEIHKEPKGETQSET